MIERKTDYPNRYYASYDITATQPTPVTGWYDTWDMSSVANVPSANDMIPVTEAQWNDTTSFRKPMGKGVKDGAIIDYTPPATPIPLTTQAQTEMAWINQKAALTAAMGETFTQDMKDYVKAIQAIISGADKTSVELPARPE